MNISIIPLIYVLHEYLYFKSEDKKGIRIVVRGLQLSYCLTAFGILSQQTSSSILFFPMGSATPDILKQKYLQPAKRFLERMLGAAAQ